MHTTITDGHGRPLPRPERDEFPPGIEGTIAFVRALHSYNDRIADLASSAFNSAFRKAVR